MFASRVCYSIQMYIECTSHTEHKTSAKRTLRWLLQRLNMRLHHPMMTGPKQWPCSEQDNAALIRLLKLYAPMLPQQSDSDAALDFYTEFDEEYDEYFPDGEPNADEPQPVRVPHRLIDPRDPWNAKLDEMRNMDSHADAMRYKAVSPYYERNISEGREGEEDEDEDEKDEDEDDAEEDEEDEDEEDEDEDDDDEEDEW